MTVRAPSQAALMRAAKVAAAEGVRVVWRDGAWIIEPLAGIGEGGQTRSPGGNSCDEAFGGRS